MTSKIVLSVVAMLLTVSCAPTWVRVGSQQTDTPVGYQVELPHDWRQYNPAGPCIFLTKDGVSIQKFMIQRVPKDEVLHNTQRTLSEGLLPQELAEAVVADLSEGPGSLEAYCLGRTPARSAMPGFLDFHVLENAPATVGQYPGFKLVYTYKLKSGLRRKAAHYGVMVDGFYYYLHFDAPARHYFGRDYATFERVKSTFRVPAGAS
jgi:hypothetical protein